MPNILEDGTIIPSYLGTSERGSGQNSTAMLSDHVLRLGEVKKLIYPSDSQSYGKKTVEYEVEVQYRQGNGSSVSTIWRGATLSTLFGGVADRFHATLRADTTNNEAFGTGSKVLLLCLAGDQQKAIILGGVEDPRRNVTERKETGHNLYFEFNGVVFTINKDGEPQLFFRGATKNNGTLKDGVEADDAGSTLRVDKQGSIILTTINQDTGDTENQFKVDHANPAFRFQSVGSLIGSFDQKFDVKANAGFRLNSSDSGMDIGVDQNVNIQSAGVRVGDADEAWVLGTTFRADLKTCHNNVKSGLNSAATQIQLAATQLNIAAGLNAIPYTGGSASQTNFQAAATALQAVSQAIKQACSALEQFESKADAHLSKVNFGD